VRRRDLERFEKRLREHRERVAKQQSRLGSAARRTQRESSGELSAYTFHMADLGTDAMEREQNFLLASKLSRTLTEIDEALRKIRAGGYGNCEHCERAIDPKRLRALPYARYCLDCQEQVDRRGRAAGGPGRS
jgi:RNA polymerase-binding transcription factor DksA